jgi:hypothetical protein
MSKRKRTAAEKRARPERKKRFMTIFINGKQKWVPRPPLIDGLSPLRSLLGDRYFPLSQALDEVRRRTVCEQAQQVSGAGGSSLPASMEEASGKTTTV